MFDLCYEPVLDAYKPARFERKALPVAGGMEDQPAYLMQALNAIESWSTDELNEDIREFKQRRETDDGGSGTRNQNQREESHG